MNLVFALQSQQHGSGQAPNRIKAKTHRRENNRCILNPAEGWLQLENINGLAG